MAIEENRLAQQLDRLGAVGQTPEGGVTRLGLTPVYMEAQALVGEWMKEAGLTPRVDAIGNLIGRREGRNPRAPAIMIGSHIDTVVNGGRFDGTVGVLGGIEVARAMEEDGVTLNHPLEVVAFLDEEGTRWGTGCLGSRAMLGLLPDEVLERRDPNGVTVAKAMQDTGLDPHRLYEAKRKPEEIATYLEMHIEQGAVLETLDYPVGVVTGIAGIVWLSVRLRGTADHAGATPMSLRHDALVPAAQLVLTAQRLATETSPSSVATVGKLQVQPGNVNAIPGDVLMTFDLRDISRQRLDKMQMAIVTQVQRLAGDQALDHKVEVMQRVEPVVFSRRIVESIAAACRKLGMPVHKLPSGAGHDAQIMARKVDSGMIFLRSKDGISHAPEELTDTSDILLGTEVLYHAAMRLDG